MPLPERYWYILHTYSGYENKVKINLHQRVQSMNMEDLIFRIEVPVDYQVKLKDGKRQILPEKVYPGYVLVEMIMTDQSWYVVRNTPGVIGFVGSGGKPLPLVDLEVEQMLERVGLEEAKATLNFKVGDSIRVVGGPFNEMIGIVESINEEKEKAKVRLSMFGREMPVELDFVNIEVI
ncbi:MAG TPA: transcription termination/antitermination protein NusG [Caldisericia bacterium]|nr:transcription termination/antitermination protein NusG [Caldisericia bacterium]HPF48438.1 transcription termination/antitermination protein NusG [Caldisericia bacterium]HPI83382.1 transcription termination/antitermination protein NusG [Caldisericia bacterium]HPQ92892.1 transcription termination/antitermination protein NusG [Caldisericia bacterium]HRV74010.1 transcription termination/antitermination protein NusG [Caldisericia bacterium]